MCKVNVPQWVHFWYRAESPQETKPFGWLNCLPTPPLLPCEWWSSSHWEPSTAEVTSRGGQAWLTFLGYLYGAVTDFTCCCRSLVSCSWLCSRNSGVRTTNAFTTCRMGVEVQMCAISQSLLNNVYRMDKSTVGLSWCLRLGVMWERRGPGSNPCPPHFHCMPWKNTWPLLTLISLSVKWVQ